MNATVQLAIGESLTGRVTPFGDGAAAIILAAQDGTRTVIPWTNIQFVTVTA